MTSKPAANQVLERIERVYAALSRAERRVADYVLANPITFTRTSISHLTARCGASAPTIMRFCRAAGFDGLTDLKLSMVAVLGEIARKVDAVGPDDLATGLLDTASEMVDRLRQQVRGDRVTEAITLLAAAPAVTCMASYQLEQAALYARERLLRHGLQALTPSSPAYQGAPGSATSSPALGLFFCCGAPDAAMADAITRYRRFGRGAIVLGTVPVEPFAQASVQITVAPRAGSLAAPCATLLLPHLLMTDLLIEGRTRHISACLAASPVTNN
jgi:DNA-binding MurR/RpiR family transcriptional regulator